MTGNKVKRISLMNVVTLEATEVDTEAINDRVIIDTFYSERLNLVAKYTVGTGETTNNCYIKMWGYVGIFQERDAFPYAGTDNSDIANDTDNWIQIGGFDVSSGTATFNAETLKIAGATAATYDAHFMYNITWPKIRITAYEDGVASNKGRLTAIALIQ